MNGVSLTQCREPGVVPGEGSSVKVDRIWWREITPEDFFVMEKSSRGLRGRAALEIRQLVDLMTFFGRDRYAAEQWEDITIDARVVGDPDTSAPIVFKAHRRHGIYENTAQNRLDDRHERHPAWLPANGWPDTRAPSSFEDAKAI